MRTFFLCCFFIGLSAALQAQEKEYRVYFETNRYQIPDSAMLSIIKIIQAGHISRVLIEGHCDSVGSKLFNKVLSEQRARSVFKLLSQNGIPSKAIRTCIGYGKDRPLNANQTASERQLNRRVVITFFIDDDDMPIVKEKQRPVTPSAKTYMLIEGDSINTSLLKVGSRLVFDHLLFEPGRHYLKEEATPILRRIFDLLNENPSLELEIQGHVCCVSTEPDGHDWDTGKDNLSEARAKAIYDFLVSNGIEKIRLEYKGYGGTQKIKLDESIEENRRVNRRVEFKVLNF